MSEEKKEYEYQPFVYDVPWDATGKYTSFTPNASTNAALTNKTNAENAYKDFVGAGYTWANQNMLNDYMSKYQNRDPFSYDFNTDAMYQQYKDKYIKQGKMAMQDTMGQAAAMTGGYGSSYASTAGNQAYQASLENLNDIIPQLYQMAYDRYNQEGQDMLNNISLLQGERAFDYGVWGDKANMLAGDRSYYSSEYDNAWNRDYGVWNDNRTFDRGVWESDRTLAHGEHQASEGVRYDEYRNAIADEQWRQEFEESQRQFNESMAFSREQYEDSKNASSGNGSGGGRDLSGIRAKCATFTNNTDLAQYLSGLGLDQETEDMLYAEYMTPDKLGIDKRTWTVTSKGGFNWFGGVNGNAKMKDNYGNEYSMDELVDELVLAGWDKAKAKQWVIDLQNSKGLGHW